MTNDKAQMSNQAQNPNDKKEYDLEERTARFGEAIIEFVKTLSRDPINDPLIRQVVRSGTSIGAQTIWKQMEQNLRKISNIKFPSVKKSLKKQNTGLE